MKRKDENPSVSGSTETKTFIPLEFIKSHVSKDAKGTNWVNDEYKQLTIVRQSTLERTLELFKLYGIEPPNMSVIVATHQMLVELILSGNISNKRDNEFDLWVSKNKK